MKLPPLRELPMRLGGWRTEGAPPPDPKYVVLACPHTSNWDGPALIAAAMEFQIEMKWMIKGSWVRGPMGVFLRRLGAVAIDRTKANNVVDQMIEELRTADRLALVIPPEGTRGAAPHWKSGFYHIARGANVPVVPGYLDYARKVAGLGPPIHLTGDVRADMDQFRAFYATHGHPLRADGSGPIRLREEDAAP